MIRSLTGKILDINEKSIVLDVSGIGYYVFVGTSTILTLPPIGNEAFLWIHTSVKEDAIELYGFQEKEELSFFEMMISVSGVGPKGALGIVSSEPIENLTRAIANSDVAYLTKFSGIGKKTAEKIIVELRDKLSVLLDEKYVEDQDGYGDVALALESLGYESREIRKALKTIAQDTKETGEIIKEAIKWLSSN